MEQANKFFFLSEVKGHVLANFENREGVTVINLRHANDVAPNRLQIRVKRVGDKFIISYDAIYNGQRITQGESEGIPVYDVERVIADVVNDTIPAV